MQRSADGGRVCKHDRCAAPVGLHDDALDLAVRLEDGAEVGFERVGRQVRELDGGRVRVRLGGLLSFPLGWWWVRGGCAGGREQEVRREAWWDEERAECARVLARVTSARLSTACVVLDGDCGAWNVGICRVSLQV